MCARCRNWFYFPKYMFVRNGKRKRCDFQCCFLLWIWPALFTLLLDILFASFHALTHGQMTWMCLRLFSFLPSRMFCCLFNSDVHTTDNYVPFLYTTNYLQCSEFETVEFSVLIEMTEGRLWRCRKTMSMLSGWREMVSDVPRFSFESQNIEGIVGWMMMTEGKIVIIYLWL